MVLVADVGHGKKSSNKVAWVDRPSPGRGRGFTPFNAAGGATGGPVGI